VGRGDDDGQGEERINKHRGSRPPPTNRAGGQPPSPTRGPRGSIQSPSGISQLQKGPAAGRARSRPPGGDWARAEGGAARGGSGGERSGEGGAHGAGDTLGGSGAGDHSGRDGDPDPYVPEHDSLGYLFVHRSLEETARWLTHKVLQQSSEQVLEASKTKKTLFGITGEPSGYGLAGSGSRAPVSTSRGGKGPRPPLFL